MKLIILRTGLALLFLVGFLALAPVVNAQTIGVIITRETPLYEEINSALAARFSNRDVKFIVQRPFPDAVAWGNAARKIIGSGVDMILTYGAAATLAVLKERPDVPVVYAGVYSPAAAVLRGKRVYGVQSKTPLASLLRYLKEVKQMDKIAVLYNSHETDSLYQYDEVSSDCEKYGIKAEGINLASTSDISHLGDAQGLDALYITSCSTANAVYGTIISVSRNQRLPVASLLYDKEKQPMVMLSPEPADQAALAAGLITEVLRGKKPASPRVESKKFILTYNLKSATDIGMKTSFGLLMDASEVVH